MDYIGKSPISLPVLILGKIAFVICAAFFIVKDIAPDSMLYDSIITQAAGIILYVLGLFMVFTSLFQLGRSVAVGIPERETELKTHGLYRITRNPIYVGAFSMCAGSCLYAIHPVNILLAIVAVAIHIRIIVKEEVFLEMRFGKRWLEYRQQVPRFIGNIRRPDPHSRQL